MDFCPTLIFWNVVADNNIHEGSGEWGDEGDEGDGGE
jgi:hypothetical protein